LPAIGTLERKAVVEAISRATCKTTGANLLEIGSPKKARCYCWNGRGVGTMGCGSYCPGAGRIFCGPVEASLMRFDCERQDHGMSGVAMARGCKSGICHLRPKDVCALLRIGFRVHICIKLSLQPILSRPGQRLLGHSHTAMRICRPESDGTRHRVPTHRVGGCQPTASVTCVSMAA
jgi:hypothetical protein